MLATKWFSLLVYNIALLGNLEQVDMAKNALQQCTSNQSVIYSESKRSVITLHLNCM